MRGRGLHRGDHVGMCVPQDHRPPRPDQVDVLGAVGVDDVGAVAAGHEPRRAADRAERPHGGVHASRRHRERAVKERGGFASDGIGGHARSLSAPLPNRGTGALTSRAALASDLRRRQRHRATLLDRREELGVTALPAPPGRLLTIAEFAALGEDDRYRWELQEGNLVMSPSPPTTAR